MYGEITAADGLITNPLTYLIAKPVQPFRHILCCISHISLADGKTVFNDCCTRLQIFYRVNCDGKTTSIVNIKRNNRLTGEIILVKKAIQHLRHIIPPCRVFFCQVWTKKNFNFLFSTTFHYILPPYCLMLNISAFNMPFKHNAGKC